MTAGDLLDFERAWPRHSHAKENAIRARGLTPARYYHLLHRAAASIEGQAHDPFTAKRVLRLRAHVLPTFDPTSTHSRPSLSTANPRKYAADRATARIL